MRQCHIRDGTALIEYFSWLENELHQGTSLDEVEASDKLEQFRRYKTLDFVNNSKQDLFVGLSFDTISATGPNGAVIHYKPEKESCRTIDPKEIYLCDSGAQYWYLPIPKRINKIGMAQQIQLVQLHSINQRRNKHVHILLCLKVISQLTAPFSPRVPLVSKLMSLRDNTCGPMDSTIFMELGMV